MSAMVGAVLVAAGVGRRFGRPKHSAQLGGRELWRWGRDALEAGGIDRIVLVGDMEGAVAGGSRRQDSVAAGLATFEPAPKYVLVHDAARPLANAALVRRVVDRLLTGDVDGVVPVIPVRDTIKVVRDGRITETAERSAIAAAQTPQGFRFRSLHRAHQTVPQDVTDDAAMIEAIGGSVAVVDGSPDNLKVTYPADLAVAEALLSVSDD